MRRVVGHMTDVLFPPLSKEYPRPWACSPPGSSPDGATGAGRPVIAEVQVDKVAAEVLAPVAGVVHLLVDEEASVAQGAPIARID